MASKPVDTAIGGINMTHPAPQPDYLDLLAGRKGPRPRTLGLLKGVDDGLEHCGIRDRGESSTCPAEISRSWPKGWHSDAVCWSLWIDGRVHAHVLLTLLTRPCTYRPVIYSVPREPIAYPGGYNFKCPLAAAWAANDALVRSLEGQVPWPDPC